VLSQMYQQKVSYLLDTAPGMAFMLLGLEPIIYSGAEAFQGKLPPTVVARGEDEDTPSNFAAQVGLQNTDGVDPGSQQDLLQVAVWCQHNVMVHKLLQLRLPGEAWHKNVLGADAFLLSCSCGNVEAARALCAREDFEADMLDVPNALGATSLHLSAETGHLEIVQLLLQRGAQVDLPKPLHSSSAGRTALHCAAANCHVQVCAELLRGKASVNARTAEGMTPLELAAVDRPLVVGNQAPSARADTLRCLEDAAKKDGDISEVDELSL